MKRLGKIIFVLAFFCICISLFLDLSVRDISAVEVGTPVPRPNGTFKCMDDGDCVFTGYSPV